MSSRKRRRVPPPPAFMDSSATVTASRFAGARLPELENLWKSISEHKRKGKANTNDVFLPYYSNQTNQKSKHLMKGTMLDKEVTRLISPHLSAGGKSQSRRHLRRRTGSHISRRRHRIDDGMRKIKTHDQLCRRAKRKPAILVSKHKNWQKSLSQVSDLSTDNDIEVNWLETHIWHAKRFKIAKLFGWNIPIQHCNRGPKAAIRLCKSKSTIQDATWENSCIEISCNDSINTCSTTLLGKIVLEVCGGMMNETLKCHLSDPSILCGYRCIDSVIYTIGLYPAGAIGPACFLMDKSGLTTTLKIFIHPTILGDSLEVFKQAIHVLHLSNCCTVPKLVSGGLGFIRVRGKLSVDLLQDSFQISCAIFESKTCTWDEFLRTSQDIPNGTVITFELVNKQRIEDNQIGNCIDNECLFIKRYENGNVFMTGWDIICKPKKCMNIFSTLHLNGASSIGLRENWALQVEAMSSHLVFPRDYPDTKQGQLYWNNTSEEWSLIRKLVEGSEKLNIPRSQRQVHGNLGHIQGLAKVDWNVVVAGTSQGTDTEGVMVVRGKSLGIPFLNILNSSGIIVQSQNRVEQSRRNRRKAIQSKIQTPIHLSHDARRMHRETCSNLQNALSLPALLLCSLRIEGKGTIKAGASIISRHVDDVKHVIGFATAGTFSVENGFYCGLCFIGAASFLSAVICDGSTAVTASSRGMINRKRIELRVTVMSGAAHETPALVYPMF